MSSLPPSQRTFGDLRRAGFGPRSLRDELRANLLAALRARTPLFPGILGYDDTVIPAVENALLCGHDFIFLGERGQAKSRMIRDLVRLLDPWLPVVAGSEIHDDPFAPVSSFARRTVEELGDDTPIAWVDRDARYVEKLATPDVSIADLIGDVDPIKVAEGRSLSDELTIHFGLLPRTNRGIFCINELPDLTEKVQVGLFNVMQERDVQVKGYRVRLPLDVLVVATANPEDYTSRGRIITPLKDRYAAQIRTHYPMNRAVEIEVMRQEARLPTADACSVRMPAFMEEIVAEITLQARDCSDVNQASGVSVRMSIANLETLAANALRRAVRESESEAVPRVCDLDAIKVSTAGKLEFEYAAAERRESEVVDDLVRRAVRTIFEAAVPLEGVASVVESFNQGWAVEVSPDMPSRDYLEGLDQIQGLRDAAARLAGGDSPALLASAIEFILEGLHLSNLLNKNEAAEGARYTRP